MATLKMAEKRLYKLRFLFDGETKGGKTLTALKFARALVGPDGMFGVIDSEGGKSRMYIGSKDVGAFPLELLTDDCSPTEYIARMKYLVEGGCQALVIDSLSHAWVGPNGVIDQVDQWTARSTSKNSFTSGWSKGTPEHNKLIRAINHCPVHLLATLRVKSDYVVDSGPKGKSEPKKIGLAAVQRDGLDYEFDYTARMSDSGTMTMTGVRGEELAYLMDTKHRVISKPGPAFIAEIMKFFDQTLVAPQAAEEMIAPEDRRPPTRDAREEAPRGNVSSRGAAQEPEGPPPLLMCQECGETYPQGTRHTCGRPARTPAPVQPTKPVAPIVAIWGLLQEWLGTKDRALLTDAITKVGAKYKWEKGVKQNDLVYQAVLKQMEAAKMRGIGFDEFVAPPPHPADDVEQIREDDIPF